jgi:hypothetical protein
VSAQKRYYQNHKTAMLQKSKDYYWSHKPKIQREQKEYREQVRIQVFTHYGGNPPKCACCGESRIEFLTIDHINNDGANQRRRIWGQKVSGFGFYAWLVRMNFPEGYQVLCFNCNCGRAHTLNKVCPHKQ